MLVVKDFPSLDLSFPLCKMDLLGCVTSQGQAGFVIPRVHGAISGVRLQRLWGEPGAKAQWP